MSLPPEMVRIIEALEYQSQGLAQQWEDWARMHNRPDRDTARKVGRVKDERGNQLARDGSRFGTGFPNDPDPRALRDWSRHRANVVSSIVASAGLDPLTAYREAAAYTRSFGVPPPQLRPARISKRTGLKPCGGSINSALRRMTCPRWWKRNARTFKLRLKEAKAIRAGKVHSHAAYAVSDEAVAWRRAIARQTAELMAGLEAVRQNDGERIAMTEIIKSSLANPRVRKAELGMRAANIERFMDARGWVGFVVHWTLESRFHPRLEKTGKRNWKYDSDGSDPRAGQEELRRLWGLARARLAKHKVKIIGMRSAEPHHDGTPHWHMLMFCAPEHVARAQQIIRECALRNNADEDGAQAHRCRIVAVDKTNGRSAAGYILKYIFKAIPGALTGDATTDVDGVQTTIPGIDATSLAERIVTWAWLWGIRQFQTFGEEVQVGIWRQFRRLHEALENDLLEAARQHVDAGRFNEFCAFRELHPMRLERCVPDVGFGPFTKLTAYGEKAVDRVLGIVMPELDPGTIALAPDGVWKIERKRENRADGAVFDGTRTRTRVNNYNQQKQTDEKADPEADRAAESEKLAELVIYGATGPPNNRLSKRDSAADDLVNLSYKGRVYTSKAALRKAVLES